MRERERERERTETSKMKSHEKEIGIIFDPLQFCTAISQNNFQKVNYHSLLFSNHSIPGHWKPRLRLASGPVHYNQSVT